MKKALFFIWVFIFSVHFIGSAQTIWKNVDSLFQPLPESVHVYHSNEALDGKPNIAYYVSVPLNDKKINFTTQIGNGKRFTPSQYYASEDHPLLVINGTFFEFIHNRNLNLVIKNNKVVAHHPQSIAGKGKDTLLFHHYIGSAIGISKKRTADIAWVFSDSSYNFAYASEKVVTGWKDSIASLPKREVLARGDFNKWKMDSSI